ncbi:MAG TPA: hypothetical protein VGL09_04135 [Methylomirabilota bacterium]|jgi:photosystem II stability/assembly factor-like uncharacterized protein
MSTRVYAGAGHWTSVGEDAQPGGLFRLTVGDDRWECLGGGLPPDADVRAIAIHPNDPRVIYAGTQHGAYRSDDGGDTWSATGALDAGATVWSFRFHPRDPEVIYAGTAPPAVYRSEDRGQTWERMPGLRPPGRVAMNFPCRVTRIAIDPTHPDEIYAGLEVDGVLRSMDGGKSWEDVSGDLAKLSERPHLRSRIASDTEMEGMLDSHALCISSAAPGVVFLAVRMGLFQSADRGATWTDMEIGRFSPLTYARDVTVSPHDPRTLVACLSVAARGDDGSLYRSQDLGRTWRRLDHGVKAEGTMMAVALHPADPDQMYCATRSGQVFGTKDGGATWREHRLPDGARDVYTIACV